MKHLLMAAAVAVSLSASAQEVIKTLYSGEPKDIDWGNTMIISAESFADDVAVGNYISLKTTQTSGAIELKSDGAWLPGTRNYNPGEAVEEVEFRTYITSDMLAKLQVSGMEICGAQFTLAEASICNDGFEMPDGAVWGGYFWVDSWNTLELFKTAFDNYDNQRYLDIYLSEDTGDYDGYFMKVLTKWDPETVIASNEQIAHSPRKATVDLQGIDLKAALADVNALMIQGNKEAGNPFNITAIALRSEDIPNGVESINKDVTLRGNVCNLQGMIVAYDVTIAEAEAILPAGLYIINGRKFVVK